MMMSAAGLPPMPAAHARARSTARLISSAQSARAPQKSAVGRLNEELLARASEASCGVPGGSARTPGDAAAALRNRRRALLRVAGGRADGRDGP
jgi:hypothetical protein